jgi:SNF2 family DNA or RNA helicase
VVITTYAQIRTEWRKQHSTTNPSCSLLYSIDWHRIILDEANHIRSLNSQVFESVSDLRARFKWCVTGTPLQVRKENAV